MILAVIIALPLMGASVYRCWLAGALGIAATWPRWPDRTTHLDFDRAGETARSPGSP
jgi:hypothetical protein